MSEAQTRVLEYLCESYSEEFGYSPFRPIMIYTSLPRATVRRACRALTRKGLAEFGKGLWTDDGEMAGSGYRATKKGRALIAEGAVP